MDFSALSSLHPLTRARSFWNGGAFGPEGGFSVTIVMVIAILLLLFFKKRGGEELIPLNDIAEEAAVSGEGLAAGKHIYSTWK